jgi:hypothetical protein
VCSCQGILCLNGVPQVELQNRKKLLCEALKSAPASRSPCTPQSTRASLSLSLLYL